jgi:hypothetical protein
MLNTPIHKENVNQNYINISPHSGQNLLSSRSQTNVGKDSEKKECLYTISRNVNFYNYYGKQYEGASKN